MFICPCTCLHSRLLLLTLDSLESEECLWKNARDLEGCNQPSPCPITWCREGACARTHPASLVFISHMIFVKKLHGVIELVQGTGLDLCKKSRLELTNPAQLGLCLCKTLHLICLPGRRKTRDSYQCEISNRRLMCAFSCTY